MIPARWLILFTMSTREFQMNNIYSPIMKKKFTLAWCINYRLRRDQDESIMWWILVISMVISFSRCHVLHLSEKAEKHKKTKNKKTQNKTNVISHMRDFFFCFAKCVYKHIWSKTGTHMGFHSGIVDNCHKMPWVGWAC